MARPRCPICRSRRWHRDRQSGLVVCEEGHILQGYRQEDNEAEGPSQHAVFRRKLRKNKEKKAAKTADPDIFHGPRLRFLYFQCAQIILRKQIATLIEVWKLPAELETVARDLWAMFVSLTNLDAEPFKADEDEHSEPSSPEKSSQRALDPLQKLYDALSDSEDESMPPLNRDYGGRDLDTQDFARAAILQTVSNNGSAAPEHYTNLNLRNKKRSAPAGPSNPASRLRLQYTLVICYLACLTLRVPILMKDLLDLAQSYKLDYLEVLQNLPADMRKHLNLAMADHELLQNHVLPVIGPDGTTTHNAFAPLINSFARMLRDKCSIIFPDINAAPILFKAVKDLGMPPRRILIDQRSSLSLSYGESTTLREFPDLSLAASIVFAAKILWGLDGTPRVPQGPDDMASALPRLNEWLDFSEKLQSRLPTAPVPAAALAQDMTALKTEEIDDFLTFFQESLLSCDNKEEVVLGVLSMPKGGTKIIDRFLPLQPLPSVRREGRQTAEREASLRQFYAHVSMPISNEASSADPLFPGQQHKIHTAPDHEGTLPQDYQRVLQLVGRVTGIEPSVIERAVYHMEISFTKQEMGWKSRLTQISEAPPQGVETQTFGKLRENGGLTPWPRDIAPTAGLAKMEKQRALLTPVMLA